jgi:hypothetical protein
MVNSIDNSTRVVNPIDNSTRVKGRRTRTRNNFCPSKVLAYSKKNFFEEYLGYLFLT